MRAGLAAVLVVIGLLLVQHAVGAPNRSWARTFYRGQTPSTATCNSWLSFLNGVDPSAGAYRRIEVWSTFNNVRYVCTTPSAINQIAYYLRYSRGEAPTARRFFCNGNYWQIGGSCGPNCGPDLELVVSPGTSPTCYCPVPGGISIRPNIFNENWGGAGGSTCRQSTQTFNVYLTGGCNDATSAPVLTCPSNQNVVTDSGRCCDVRTYSVTATDADPCSVLSGPTRTAGKASGSCFNNGDQVSYRVSDSGGNVRTCTWRYTVTDNQNPIISCPSSITTNTAAGVCYRAVSYTNPTVSDNCGVNALQRIGGPASGSNFGIGTTTVTWRATDTSGRTSTCSFTVRVNDNQAPSANCPGSVSVNNNPGQCRATVAYSTPTISDNCSGGSITRVSGPASGTLLNVGTTTTTWRATDASGLTDTCSISLTVNDVQNPSISCPGAITTGTETNRCDSRVSYSTPTATDNCAISSIVRTGGPASGSYFSRGTTIVTHRATDSSGRTATCSFSVTVNDVQNPSISCPSAISTTATGGQCSAVVSYSAPSTSDNCGGVSLARIGGPASGSTVPVGSTTVTYRATDTSGRTSVCSFSITVADTQNPSISCPASITTNAATGSCGRAVSYSSPSYGDNCSGSSLQRIAGLASGSFFPVGVTTQTFRVTDASGRTATCSFSVRVNDNQAPVPSCPSSITTNAAGGLCQRSVSYTAPTVTDNCGGSSIARTSGQASGSAFSVGTTTQVFTATDASGNTAACSFNVVVLDNQNPTITCPASRTVSTTTGCGATVTYPNPTPADNCGGVTYSRVAGQASGTIFPLGTTTQTFLATDASGRTASCSFAITVVDDQNPSANCPSAQNVNTSPGVCGAAVNYPNPSASDNCPGASIALFSGIGDGGFFPSGSSIEVYRATDAAGNTAQCSFSVAVYDNEPPVASCPSSFSVSTGLMQCGATVSYTAPSVADNCGGASISQTGGIASGGFFPVGTTTQTFTAVDATGNTGTCTFTVTVSDGEDPVATCPSNVVEPSDAGSCGAVVMYAPPSANDNCPGYTITMVSGIGSGGFFPVGSSTEIYEATDPEGNTHQCAFTVTVFDNESPVALCTGNVNANTDPSVCTAVVSYTPTAVSDNCPGASVGLSSGFGNGGTFPLGISSEQYTATDVAGNTASCSLTVDVDDRENPILSCPSTITTNTDIDQCYATVSFTDPFISDNCVGATVSLVSGLSSGSNFPTGTTSQNYQGIDGSGNGANCFFEVIVNDRQLPVITCPANIVTTADTSLCGAFVTYSTPTSSDNCPGRTINRSGGLGSNALFPVGTTTEVWEVSDASGNSASCSFTVTVTDNENPVASCPGPVSVTTDPGSCSAVVTYSPPTVGDNCAGSSISLLTGIGNGGTFPIGVSTEVYQAVDAYGNTHQCSFTVTVTDDENPIATCPASFAVDSDPGVCSAVVTFSDPSVTDNCSGSTIALLSGIPNGGSFPHGVNVQIYEATDAEGNTHQCTFTVTVNDAEDPVASCPSNIVTTTDPGDCAAVVSYSAPTVSDNCPGSSITIFSGLGDGGTFPKGVSTETYEATDATGNTHQCSFTITVNDAENPVATCIPDISVSNDAGVCGAVVSHALPTASDNCPGYSIGLLAGLGTGTFFPEGTSTELYEAVDAEGNTHTCDFLVTVFDSENPVITCPAGFAVGNDVGSCGAVVSYPMPTATDNCAVDSIVRTGGLGSGDFFPVGVSTQIYLATDVHGNTHTCTFDVTVNEVEDPVATCPGAMTVSTDAGVCGAIATYATPTITDNCPGATVVQVSGIGSGNFFPTGETVEIFEVTDGAGNTHQCSFPVIVVDNEAPVALCPFDRTVQNDAGLCSAVVTYSAPTVTDNCPGAAITLDVGGIGSGNSFPVGFTSDVFTATDLEGNTHSCSIGVIVTDTEDPVPSCNANISRNTDGGDCGAVVAYPPPTVADNCPGASISHISGLGSGTRFPLGTTTEGYMSIDGSGNRVPCSFDVIVSDNEQPLITCATGFQVVNDPGQCGAVATYAAATATDNCAVSVVRQIAGVGSGNFFNVGSTTETWESVDASGNTAQCSLAVTVLDSERPIITCPASVTVNNDPGSCGAVVSYVAPSATDNCVTLSIAQTAGLGSSTFFPIGSTTETYTATDASGNAASCSFVINVLEAEDPVATCPSDIDVPNDLNQCGAVVTYTAPTASDNCPGSSISQTGGIGSGNFFNVGVTTEIYTATDSSGRTHSCQFTVTVRETQPPVTTCPSSMASPNAPGQCGTIVSYTAPTVSDNCPGATIAQTAGQGSGSFFSVGTTSETYLGTDAAGNTHSCTFGVTVNDVERPTPVCHANMNLPTDPGVCNAVVTYSAVTVADNCAGATITAIGGLGSGATYPLGSTTESYLATDAVGLTSSCSFNIVVSDAEAPVIAHPGDYAVYVDEPYNFSVSATDNCGTVTLVQDFGPAPTDSSPVVTEEDVQFTATDAVGNRATILFTISVLPVASGLSEYVYMYEDIELIVAPSAFNYDPWVQFEIRQRGNGPMLYRSERVDLVDSVRFHGPSDMMPGAVAFWMMSTSREEWIADVWICASRYVNFPEGCAQPF